MPSVGGREATIGVAIALKRPFATGRMTRNLISSGCPSAANPRTLTCLMRPDFGAAMAAGPAVLNTVWSHPWR
jgi:hypothetical protein